MLKPLALDNVGRKGLDLLLSCGSCSVMFSTWIGLDERGVRQSEKRVSVGVCSGVGDCRSML